MNDEPTREQVQAWAHSFGGVVDAYDRARPTYPREAAAWLVGQDAATVLELGAGTGKLTSQLVDLGHDVVATDPDPAMLARLQRNLPEARTIEASAEELPVGDRAFDVVVAAQAFHWFDLDRALPEIARVLKPGGRLSLVWNWRDDSIPWVRRLGALIGTQEQQDDPTAAIGASDDFGDVEESTYSHWQQVDRKSIQDLVLSRSNVAVLDEEARAAKLAEVVAFYDDYGRGMDGMQLPYVARCYRATVAERPGPEDDASDVDRDESGGSPSDGTDTDTLLIDFR
jgi:ubiquinone/menaquinone biosynthesis C-methylase UbiE